MTGALGETLLSPVRLGDLTLPNRVVHAPIIRCRAGPGDVAGASMAEYYAQRAEAGLLIGEAVPVSPEACPYPATAAILTDEQMAGWRAVADAVHDRGGRIFAQLWHAGRIVSSPIDPGEALKLKPPAAVNILSLDEIAAIVGQFRRAGARAREAGFDGVEIHAANGYLLDQFLRDGANGRADRYGGGPANRCRLLSEIVDTLASGWGSQRIGVRCSPVVPVYGIRDSDPERTFGYLAELLRERGIAYLHVNQAGRSGFAWRCLKDLFGGPYIANGGYGLASAEAAIAAGNADLVSFGMAYLANPDLVERFRRRARLNLPEPATFFTAGPRGYLDYPTLPPFGRDGRVGSRDG